MTIDDRLTAVFSDVLGLESLTLSDDLEPAELPGWDSLAHVNALFMLENEFGVQFGAREFSEARTMGDLKSLLLAKGVRDD